MSIIVGADIGKYQAKFYCQGGGFKFRSLISPALDTKNEKLTLSDQRLLVHYKEQEYFVGKLAEDEGGGIYINSSDISKTDEVTLINLLTGLHRIPSNHFTIVISNPFNKNSKEERNKLRNLLLGEHEITVNNIRKRIVIERVGINVEAFPAFYTKQFPQNINIMDFGSSTIHCLAIREGDFISSRSYTHEDGMESLTRNDYENISLSLYKKMLHKWDDGDFPVLLIGGGYSKFEEHIRKLYKEIIIHPDPIFATAMGNYWMGVESYG